MRILIFSDSHNYDTNMKKALSLNHNRFDLCIHLGDGCREFEALAEQYSPIPFVCVNGNGEDFFGSTRVNETVLNLEGYRILLCHGHRYNVKFGNESLIYRALEKNCDIVLYGHTHYPYLKYEPELGKRGLYLFNPGSITSPPYSHKPGYGTLELSAKGIVFNKAFID